MVKGNSTVPVGVEVGGGLVGHVGLYLLGRFADRMGVGEVLSAPFGSGDGLVHDRGAVLVHAMLMPAGGGEACTDVEFLRSEPGLFGRVGSDSTLYRTMRSIDSGIRAGLGEGMATVRERVWDRLSTDPTPPNPQPQPRPGTPRTPTPNPNTPTHQPKPPKPPPFQPYPTPPTSTVRLRASRW